MKKDPSSTVQSENRRLAAIMFTDIVGFSRQMGSNEARTLRLLDTHNRIIQQTVAEHQGTVIKTVGDAFLVDFPSVGHAVQGAQQIQAQFRAHNTEKEKAEQIHVRIGIHLGDIVQKDGDVFGDGVNIASRLQGLAEPDSICLSDVVYRDVAKKLDLGTVVSLGRPKLKNIAQRFPVYALLSQPLSGLRHVLRVQRLKLKQWQRPLQVTAAVLVAVWVGAVTFRTLSLPTLSLGPPHTDSQPTLPLPDKPSIVVLPFVNLSNDPEQEYFSDGITEDITSDLSKISNLFVIARNSAFTYKGKAVKVQDVSRDMGVRYVLEGSVRRSDTRVRITAQLIDATMGGHLWSERYDRELKEIFALQDEITQKIVTTLKLQLTLWEQGILVRKTTSDVEAYDYYLRGMDYFLRYTKEANAQARQMFEKAIELDPTYAEVYPSLGFTYWQEWWSQWNPNPQTLEQAFALAQKAIALDDSSPTAHLLLASVYLQKKQHEQALTEAERTAALAPNSVLSYTVLGQLLNFMGRLEEAVKVVEKAVRLDPRSPVFYLWTLGQTYRLMGRYEEAIAAQKRALTVNPNYLPCSVHLASMYGELGREEEARAAAAGVLRLSPNFSVDSLRPRLPYKDPAAVERILNGLRKAGLK
jgi:adenylate cyclase